MILNDFVLTVVAVVFMSYATITGLFFDDEDDTPHVTTSRVNVQSDDDYEDMESYRQHWRAQAKEKKLRGQLRQVSKTKKTLESKLK